MKKKLLSLFLAVLMSLSLAVPAFAVGETEIDMSIGQVNPVTMELLEDIFENAQRVVVYDSDGQDITRTFISKYQSYYEQGDYLPIATEIGEKELQTVCTVEDDSFGNTISPRLVVNKTHKTSSKISISLLNGRKTYTARFHLKMTSTINDSTNTFSTVNPPQLDQSSLTKDVSSMEVHWNNYPHGMTFSSDSRSVTQEGFASIYYSGKSVDNIWKVTGKTSSTVLTCVRA